jgi:transcriptional regulator with XRE-family HTH domain
MKTEMAIRIKELRTRRGFSQEELSERTGLSLRTIQRIENGETEPRGDTSPLNYLDFKKGKGARCR